MAGKKLWQTVLCFGILQCLVTGFGTFFDLETGIGLYFMFINSYFNTVIVLLPMLLLRRFWVGTLVYLPWAVSGLFVEYYLEYYLNPVLKSPWYVLAWCITGLAIGFSADIAFKVLSSRDLRVRAALTALIMNGVNFLLFSLLTPAFYVSPAVPLPDGKTLLGAAYYGVPWLAANSIFGAYTALKIYEGRTGSLPVSRTDTAPEGSANR